MNVNRLVRISLFSALIGVGAFIKVPIPYCPITLQTIFVAYAGLMLGERDGAAAVLVYLMVGLVGVPVFTAGGGLAYIFQPTFGYLIGMVPGAWVMGRISRSDGRKWLQVLVAGCLCFAVIYLIGLPYMALILNGYMKLGKTLGDIVATGFSLSLPGDVIKLAVIAITAPSIQKRIAMA